jgi:hypothetical protein
MAVQPTWQVAGLITVSCDRLPAGKMCDLHKLGLVRDGKLWDRDVATEFYRPLRPGGVLHLCCPNRLHPRHQTEVLNTKESCGHVRVGHTEDDYRTRLEPIGFQIECVVGIGTPAFYHTERVLRAIGNEFGD